MFPQVISFINESHFFNENFFSKQDYLLFLNYDYFLFIYDFSIYNFLQIADNSGLYTKSLITFINQTEDMNAYSNIDNITAIYHYSIPNTKLAYPEPFIASPSFMHTDLWFIHILVYQYWLWFVFVFIIVFFLITFICTIRWCNMRVRPRRETRGVSRSKCGDLVTACVPVTWATSIIVNESTDAIDYYDGFGTTELVVGIRAYQWGWEYYYPKDIDLNYNIKPNYSTFVGNSLKYTKASDVTLSANNLWKFYQNKTSDHVVTPAHLLVLPIDNYKLLNFLNFNDIGSSPIQELNAFKRVRMFSKTFTSNLVFTPVLYSNKYKNFSNLYLNETLFTDSYLYGLKRQHNFLSSNSLFNNNATFLNLNSVNTLVSYNFKNYTNNYTTINSNLLLDVLKNHNSLNSNNTLLRFINLFNNFLSLSSLTKANALMLATISEINNFFLVPNAGFKDSVIFSQNQLISTTSQDSQTFTKMLPGSLNDYFTLTNNMSGLPNPFLFSVINPTWFDLPSLNKLDIAKPALEYSCLPVVSNHSQIGLLNKETSIANFFNNTYWNFYWLSASIDWKIYNNQCYRAIHRLFYLPVFNFYYDYDFRNWQAIEMLEDAFWESTYSIYNHDEYLNLTNDFYEYEFFDKISNVYNSFNRLMKFQDRILTQPFFKDTNSTGEYYANHTYVDDVINPANLLATKDFFSFPLFSISNYLEDSYESLKYLSYLTNANNKILLNSYVYGFQPYSYAYVFDIFRSDYDEFSWFIDENSALKSWAKNMPNIARFWITFQNIDSLKFFNEIDANLLFPANDDTRADTFRFSNNLNLRSPVKNSIVTYNAIQKVFRTRFDENRSNAKLTDFGYLYSKQPLISSPRVPYEKILGKNKENFLKINFYKNNFQPFINNFYELNSSLNFYFFDFPFLLALKSDASRYLWFDWFAKWGSCEVQPSSSSRYAIYGMPYFAKNFEYSTTSSENLTESETYLLRIARARRNYLPNWTYTPYFYAKNMSWYRDNLMFEISNLSNNSLISTKYLLNTMGWYWNNLHYLNCHNDYFFPSESGVSSYTKLNWKPQSSIQSYYYSISNLIDILTKREYLYRELFSINNKIINLPFYLTNNPANPLINEVKASFLFIDPIIYNNEYSRDIYYSSLNFFNFTVLKTFLLTCNDFINISLITDYLFYYFFDINSVNPLQHNAELYKNQYRPLRKGITNMIRLHATGAIAMPIEIRLQILASSKDVIHSWAIPSAGIKIDCIPGYSSHKVIIFLVSGIFWGQCMEVCGRYHHWMPIVVYFMKRDLFFLWCTHFIFLTGSHNMWNINDRQFTDYIRLVSFDKYSWLSEISN